MAVGAITATVLAMDAVSIIVWLISLIIHQRSGGDISDRVTWASVGAMYATAVFAIVNCVS